MRRASRWLAVLLVYVPLWLPGVAQADVD
ncbi:MAG: hypothetical protein JWP01_4310, partial [Myxococcales bacterium]|nr:hypothetical protein [Myxococcales bacterium]